MELSSNTLVSLCERLPRRERQLDTLLKLFGQRMHCTYPCISVYGHSATGKSATISAVLEVMELPHVIINCTECYTTRILFESILNGISKTTLSPENDYSNYSNCDNINDFVRYLKMAIELRQAAEETVYIVLDKAERLRNMSSSILPVFLRLQELTKMNICVILISEIVWEKFRTNSGLRDPFVLHFPEYSKDDLLEILSGDCPKKFSLHLYKNYLQLVLSVFYLVCRNLSEIRYLAKQNFPKYVEPISIEGAVSDSQKLWKNIEPQLKKSLHNVYLRQSIFSADKTPSKQIQQPGRRIQLELPYYSKYLLIATYLASYNPSKLDRRFFMKSHERVNKRAQLNASRRRLKVSNHLLGPKAFPLDRMLAIFHSIIEEKVNPSAHIFSQISSLVSLNLMAQVGRDESLDSPKYKCLVSYDFICAIARTVSFDITRYLYDFM